MGEKMKKGTVLVVVVSLFMILQGMSGIGAAGEQYKNVFIEHLEAGPAQYLGLNVHGRNGAEIDTVLAEIYHANDLKPYWLENGHPTRRAEAIKAVLDDARSQGLDPDDYFTGLIHRYWDSRDTTGQVRLDLLLTLGMMRFVADQREGRLAVREIDPKLFASARNAEVPWRPLWKEAFAAADMKKFLDDQAPPFQQYAGLVKKLAEYRVLAALGGWPMVPQGEVIKPGMSDARIPILRKRLQVTGELVDGESRSAQYDGELENAVRVFQRHHGLEPDGIVGKQTLEAMNVPIDKRIEQIILNMERYRWLDRSILDERLVVVNIAGFTASAGSGGRFDLTMPVVVGKEYQQTPIFNDTIKYIEFNPFWTVPPSIASNETLPRLRKNRHYLRERKMRLFSGWDADAKELDSTKINWSKVSPKQMQRYRIRQDPGPGNDLGTLKIMFPNSHNVYLHDTPQRALFNKDRRAFSHGCIRLGKPVDLASWLLGGPQAGWSIARINQLIATGKRQVVVLDKPVPIHLLYRTAVVADNGIFFYDDIYGRDRLISKALFEKKD